MEENYEKRGYLLEDFRLFHLKDSRGTNIDYHYHEFYKVVFLLSGSGSYVVEGRHYRLTPGDVVLVGSRVVHRPRFEPGISYERIILYISPELLRSGSTQDYPLEELFSGRRGHVLRPTEELRRRLLSLSAQLEAEMSGQEPGRGILSRCTLLRMLVEIGNALRRADARPGEPLGPQDGKILDILRYLDGHLEEQISIDELASRFFISKYHMMRRFREETGTSIHSYLSGKRLLLARELIQAGRPATDACFSCGFHSYSAFSRAYGKLFGVTPTGRMAMLPVADNEEE